MAVESAPVNGRAVLCVCVCVGVEGGSRAVGIGERGRAVVA